MRKATAAVVVLGIFCCLVGVTRAQSTNAALTGLVTDPSKAVITGATVTAINESTSVRYEGATNSSGSYYIPGLPPGTYRVEIEKVGFKTVLKPNVVLHVQDTIELNFEMAVGSASETVTVEAGAPIVNTQDASVSTVVDQSYVANMPLNGRSFQDLILLAPGVITQTPQAMGDLAAGLGISGEFSVNGQRPEENYYTVDGVSANTGSSTGGLMLQGAAASGSLPASTALGTTQALVSVDELQEFRVQTSTYSAEYGRNPGGQIAFETKSGTNQWHGTAYDYLRNDFFDANDWFNNYFGVKEPPLRQNDFGGTLGAPIRIPHVYNGKDKTFFFVSYEGSRLREPQAASVNFVPDATTIANTPSPLQQALQAYPVANGPDFPSLGLAEYIASWSNPNSINSRSVRFDQLVGGNLRLFFRFNDTDSSATLRGGGSVTPSSLDTTGSTIRTYTVGATQLISSRISNDARFNYTWNQASNVLTIDAFGGATPVDLVQLSGLPAGSSANMALLFGNGGNNQAILNQGQTSGTQKQWNLVDTLSLSWGRHQFKFGVDYRRLTPVAIQPPAFAGYSYGCAAPTPTCSTAVESNQANTNLQAFSPAYPLYTNFSAFAQDEWRVLNRLTLSVGLRWEVDPPPGVTRGLNSYTLIGTGPSDWNLAPQGTPLWKTTWYNFAPRLGADYLIRSNPGWETVVRAGGGVFFDTGQQLASSGFVQGPGFFALGSSSGSSFPIPAQTIPQIQNPPQPGTWAGFGFPAHLQLPYTLQWNASFEQSLGKSQALTLMYVGAHASRLLRQTLYFPGFLTPPQNNNSCCFTWTDNGLTSDYDSGQVQYRRRLSQGLTALASYTWAHAIDYGSQNVVNGYQRGNSDLDVRHTMSSAFSYDVPNLGHSRLEGALLHHWGLDNRFTVRSGFPVTLIGSGFQDPTGKIYDEGLNLVQNQPIYLYGNNCANTLQGLGELQPGQGCPGGRAINPNAFMGVDPSTCPPTAATCLGNAPRNFVRGFGAWQMDMAVRREFPLYENLKLQFRAETFNIFNHPSFGAIGDFLGSEQFGLATSTLANSFGTESSLYQMGGPRSMQFALKLIF